MINFGIRGSEFRKMNDSIPDLFSWNILVVGLGGLQNKGYDPNWQSCTQFLTILNAMVLICGELCMHRHCTIPDPLRTGPGILITVFSSCVYEWTHA
jgi:hypothetical protein